LILITKINVFMILAAGKIQHVSLSVRHTKTNPTVRNVGLVKIVMGNSPIFHSCSVIVQISVARFSWVKESPVCAEMFSNTLSVSSVRRAPMVWNSESI